MKYQILSTLSLFVSILIGTLSKQIGWSTKNLALSNNPDDLRFIFYTATNTSVELTIGDSKGAREAGFQNGLPLVFLIDGFNTRLNESKFPALVADGIMSSSRMEINTVSLNWERLNGANAKMGIFNHIFYPIFYTGAIGNVDVVGSRVADFLYFVSREFEVPFRKIHIIGHSLGSHTAGSAGKFVQLKYRGEVGRISGLDPAGPGFEPSVLPQLIHKLTKRDASFVDIYHTNQDTLGDFERDTGHVNIFVNGGNYQPGCSPYDAKGTTTSDTILVGFCSHVYSWVFFKNSITSNGDKYLACPCSGRDCNCKNCFRNGCNDSVTVGMWISKELRGDYFARSEDPNELFS